ncbi:MAG TPA: 2-C-methyl-D-erythritol 4-phosphate cytidylyltransferase, partial [Nitrospiria bacterium]|nr:2-C-methyl-D-erythritol 4-phosphate cytidylyltransferase [Nitrospiria bacterium]
MPAGGKPLTGRMAGGGGAGEKHTRTAAIIPAAGQGRRIGSSKPKQFLVLLGKPLLYYSLDVFEKSGWIDEIYLVVPEGMESYCREEILEKFGFKKIKGILKGGQTRQDSVYQGLTALPPDIERVVVHDGVRPFLTGELLGRAVRDCTREIDGVVVAVPLKDTPKRVRAGGWIDSTVNREGLYLAQTPQVFWAGVFKEAYKNAGKEGLKGTDDSALVEEIGGKIRILEGSGENIKVTTPEDLAHAERILEN